MKKDNYLDYVDELRRYHQSLSFEISPNEWAKIVPEAINDVSIMLLDRCEELEKTKKQIEKDLMEVKNKDETTQALREVFIEITLAKKAVRLENEISWLKRYLANFAEERPEIGEEEIEQARNVPLESLIDGLKLKSGKLVMCCPFHDEKTPSFTVFKSNSYYCFGCGESGNSISYVMKTKKIGFIEAIKYLLKM